MESLSINKTASTPSVSYNTEANTFSIIGRSYPENARDFYIPIIKWINENYLQITSPFVLEINLEYYNTASSKFILEILHKFEELYTVKNIDAKIIWQYLQNDDDMKDAGKEYMQIVKMPFEFAEIAL